MKKIDEILSNCIQSIEDGKDDIESLTNKFPEYKNELTKALQAYTTLKTSDLPKLSLADKENAAKRLMNLLPEKEKIVTESKAFRPYKQEKKIFKQRRNAMTWIVIASLVFASLAGGTGTVLAAQDSLPGDGLYGVKTSFQDLRLALSNDETDVGLLLRYMDENIDDVEQLMKEGRFEDMGVGLSEYDDNLQTLSKTRDRIDVDDPGSGDQVKEQIQIHLEEQTQQMQQLQLQLQTNEQIQTKLQETIRSAENGMGYGPGEVGEPAGPGGDPLIQNGGEGSNGNGDDQEPGNPDSDNGAGGKPEDAGSDSSGGGGSNSGSGNGG